MNKRNLLIALGIIILLGAGVTYALMNRERGEYGESERTESAEVQPTTPTTTPVVATTNSKTYTLSDVSTHTSPKDCWTTVSGSVYDLTDWIAKHPGGDQAILTMCGKDATSAYTDQHGGQRKPEQILESYKIGTLTK